MAINMPNKFYKKGVIKMKVRLISSILLTTTLITTLPIGVLADEHKSYWLEVGSNKWMYKEGDSFATGWRQLGNKWYYFNSDGYMAHDTTIDGYILGSDGAWENSIPNNTAAETAVSKKPSKEKLETTPDFSWFQENGNTYFKVTNRDYCTGKIHNNPYLIGMWNIDDSLYYFDLNGVLQKGEIAADGEKYLFGNDGKYIKCTSNENIKLYCGYGITTRSTTSNTKVDIEPNFEDSLAILKSDPINKNTAATIEGKTLICKTGQTVRLLDPLVLGTDTGNSNISNLPNLIIKSYSSDHSVAFLGIRLYKYDGEMRVIIPYVIPRKIGKTTITLDVNGTKTSFDVAVTE